MGEVGDPMLPRKTSSEPCAARTPNRLSDQVENTKAIETTMVKELAKCPVTSEKGDPNRQPPAGRSGKGRRGPGPSDCLLKTQVRAKSQDEVYGLTPARCWKVKGRVKPTRWVKLRT